MKTIEFQIIFITNSVAVEQVILGSPNKGSQTSPYRKSFLISLLHVHVVFGVHVLIFFNLSTSMRECEQAQGIFDTLDHLRE
jgi:hypothetical protein